MATGGERRNHCKNPTGWLGRFALRNMNSRHSKVTDWGLLHLGIEDSAVVLDVGCGGGKTIAKLAEIAGKGKIYGIDHSAESVAFATKTNRKLIDRGRVDIRQASVSRLPFADGMFDAVTAVETHFWWPDLPGDMREVVRVLKPGGVLLVVAEIYKGAQTKMAKLAEKYLPLSGMALLTLEEHRELLIHAGCCDVQVHAEESKRWICCVGKKR